MVFGAGLFVGLIAGLNAYGLLTYNINTSLLQSQQESWDSCESMLTRAKTGTSLQHNMTDTELFCRALAVSSGEEIVSEPKISFLFLVNDNLPLLPLWEKFFSGHQGLYSIYVHSIHARSWNLNASSVFYARTIPSRVVEWGRISMVDAEKRLVANALLDVSNKHFVLLSESCIPLYNFTTVYNYLISSNLSHVESYDNPGRRSRGRYNKFMAPQITLSHWRKGSQWFEIQRPLAQIFIADNKYYLVFKRFCKPTCYPDEHYLPTLLNIFDQGSLNSNRSLTWVDWTKLSPHPAQFKKNQITQQFLQKIHDDGISSNCTNESQPATSIYFLFARKFHPSSLEPLLAISSRVMGF
ncbi:hypothetical protein SUGI_0285500 [Cryptomeria japonica]|nr:hypothetical protein SUGI_0285500 [Cryptomeria japonica]